ncbi:MAG: hypothetical protein C3F07_21680 [Anaerolineales bacterium]|nr:hypothetical protein [Anaerolineae bacterium]PWB68665.1 MAG: hypothetical protein C3F07_21680 [Anaerolineales bacterium]
MLEILIATSTWLHTLATVIFIGYFVLLALICLPALKDIPDIGAGSVLGAISKRSRLWMYAALLIFMVTGIHLMLVDPNYLGVGNFGNLWSLLMLIKHFLILGMIAAGFGFNAILRVGLMLSSNTRSAQAMDRFRLYSNGMAIAGVLVLLLTSLSQVK